MSAREQWRGQAAQGRAARAANAHPDCDDFTPDMTCWECMEDHVREAARDQWLAEHGEATREDSHY